MRQTTFRNQGAKGALLDEYERAIFDLKSVISNVSEDELSTIVDLETNNHTCRSIQTLLSHVVSAGYNYVVEIRRWIGENKSYTEPILLSSIEKYNRAIDKMFQCNITLFEEYPNLQLDNYECQNKIKVRWGQHYDVEQLLEHAIVHILRQRRQIERFLLRLR